MEIDYDSIRNSIIPIINEEDNRYNIMMLGTSGVGKTVFMTSMLHDLLIGNTGLNIDAETSLKEQIFDNYKKICNGEILAGTARHSEWSFSVNYNDMKLFEFNWIDYKGGVIDYKDLINNTSREFKQVFENLNNSIAVFVIADGEKFLLNESEVHKELKAIRVFLDYSLKYKKRPMNLLLLLGKSDAIGLKSNLFMKYWKTERLSEYCDKVFSKSFANFTNDYKNSLCDCIPISSYGKSAKISRDRKITVEKTQKLESYQIHAPLLKTFHLILLAIQYEIPLIKKELEFERNSNENDKKEASSKLFLDSLNPINHISRNGRNRIDDLKRIISNKTTKIEFLINRQKALREREKCVKKAIRTLSKQSYFGKQNF